MTVTRQSFARHGLPSAPVRSSGKSLVLRAFCMLIGAAMVTAAFGLWIVPGTGHAPEFALIKLGASLLLLICGLCSLVFARSGQS